MTSPDTIEETPAAQPVENVPVIEVAPEANKNDSVVIDLWSEDTWNPPQKEDVNASEDLKIEFETLTLEKERLKKENRRLAEMLESIKLEEDIAALKKEVSTLGGENEQLLAEIQRRKQSIGTNASASAIPNPGN